MGATLHNTQLRSGALRSQVIFVILCNFLLALTNSRFSFACRLAEILEEETEQYMQKDPDPFDERHPSRIDPASELGKNLKLLFKKEQFMSRLVNDYLRDNFFTRQSMDKSSNPLNLAACRLILIIMPGLETSAVFQVSNDQLINRLYDWAEKGEEPLRSYATGLLGAAMDIQDIAVAFRDQNIRMLPLLLQRLKSLQVRHKRYGNVSSLSNGESKEEERPFSHLGGASSSKSAEPVNGLVNGDVQDIAEDNSQCTQERTIQRNMIALHPPTLATSQMLILRYLAPMGEYQEFLPYIFENNAMDIIFNFIDKVDPKDLCLAFEALKYLASLLCHKKCCIEFLSRNGLQVSFASLQIQFRTTFFILETFETSSSIDCCNWDCYCLILSRLLRGSDGEDLQHATASGCRACQLRAGLAWLQSRFRAVSCNNVLWAFVPIQSHAGRVRQARWFASTVQRHLGTSYFSAAERRRLQFIDRRGECRATGRASCVCSNEEVL